MTRYPSTEAALGPPLGPSRKGTVARKITALARWSMPGRPIRGLKASDSTGTNSESRSISPKLANG